MPKKNIISAMFDIRPIRSGVLNFEKMSRINPRVNLRKNVEPVVAKWGFGEKVLPGSTSKHFILRELEKTLTEPLDIVAELASVGARVHPFVVKKAKTRVLPKQPKVVNELLAGRVELTVAHTPVSREMEILLRNIKKESEVVYHEPARIKPRIIPRIKPKYSSWFRRKFFIFAVSMISGGSLVYWAAASGLGAKNNIVRNGNNAVANLQDAKQKLKDFDFSDAASSFALAYDDFNKASGTLNNMGAAFLSVFGNMPGLSKVKAANDLVEAGQNISQAGENLASAFSTLYKTNLFSLVDESSSQRSFANLISEFKSVLISSDRNIKKATNLLANIDSSVIPEDKRPLFEEFKTKVPEFQGYVNDAINYSDFMSKFVGSSGRKTYIMLLQNNSELRPTGGFPGTYAYVSFQDGFLKKIYVDDIYQIDSNLKENIIPPVPMQHITPNWGMRDANWFADFPTSARKVEEFYKKDGGGDIDGVLTITPDVITKIFKIIGPIDMPEYGLKLDADNFLDTIQNQVEYASDKSKPKKILTDLQPRFFEKLAHQDKSNWLEIFKILLSAAEEKHMLAYFNSPDLEAVALKHGFSGEVKDFDGDYLQVAFSNVKGFKTDLLTDNFETLKTSLNGSQINHTLAISRVNNGGSTKFGFYNRENPSYVRVYVPKGSVLKSIQGISRPDFRPLISYGDFGFKKDRDLEMIEGSTTHPFPGVDVFQEGDKTVFAFWMITKPKQKTAVTLDYTVPFAGGKHYGLYWQKQSGTGQDALEFSFKVPDGKEASNYSSDLKLMNGSLVMSSDLSVDREVGVDIK